MTDATPTHTLVEVERAIERGEIAHLTSDVFDTVLWRPVARPTDLFPAVARRLRDDHGWTVDGHRFAIARIDAEARARRTALAVHGTHECTIEEIWAHVPPALVPVGGSAADGIDAELAVEAASLHLHRAVTDLFGTARRHGVGITLVSDIYLSSAQLAGLLRTAGLDLDGIEIVTSSERRRTKWDGLLDDVFERHGGAAGCLHLGDNPVADVVVARRAGAAVCHVDVAADDDAVDAAATAWARRSAAVGTDGGRSAMVRETLVRAGDDARRPSYQFGVGVAGPVMTGFAAWAAATARELGAGAIHCLLREGARISELIDLVDPGAPPRVLVHASRWGVMRAAVITGSADELERSLSRRADLTADHVADAFGLDPARVERVLGAPVVPRVSAGAAFEALADDDDVREQIVASAERLRAGVVRYLERTLRLDDGPLVLCDIGWGGTIQEGITDILAAAGITPRVVGLYSLLSPSGERRAARGADLRAYLPTIGHDGTSVDDADVAVRHPEFLERINTPELGTLLEFDHDGSPVTLPDDHDPIPASLALAQRGVVDFCRTWAGTITAIPDQRTCWSGDPGHAAAALRALATVITAPDPRLAAELGTWPHDDVAGTAHEELAGSSFVRWIPYANAVDAADITMHEVFWVPGAASAARSPLAHQIAALADGAHPDALCPPSPTGTARIAVFPPDSPLASAQQELVPRLGAAGWMLLRLTTPVPGVRSVRIDVGDRPVLVELADAQILAITAPGTSPGASSGERVVVDGVADLRRRGTWNGGRWLSERRAAVDAGGHLLVDLPDGADVRQVAVAVAFRTWELSDGERRRWLLPLKAAPLTRRLARVARRIIPSA